VTNFFFPKFLILKFELWKLAVFLKTAGFQGFWASSRDSSFDPEQISPLVCVLSPTGDQVPFICSFHMPPKKRNAQLKRVHTEWLKKQQTESTSARSADAATHPTDAAMPAVTEETNTSTVIPTQLTRQVPMTDEQRYAFNALTRGIEQTGTTVTRFAVQKLVTQAAQASVLKARLKETTKEVIALRTALEVSDAKTSVAVEAKERMQSEVRNVKKKLDRRDEKLSSLKLKMEAEQARVDTPAFKEETAKSYVLAQVKDGNEYKWEFRQHFADFASKCYSEVFVSQPFLCLSFMSMLQYFVFSCMVMCSEPPAQLRRLCCAP
jgi:hypothetical protein